MSKGEQSNNEVSGIPIGLGLDESSMQPVNVQLDDSLGKDDLDKQKPAKKKYVYPQAECPICHHMFQNKYTLKSHMQRHTEDGKPVKSRGRVVITHEDELRFNNTKECLEYVQRLINDLNQCQKYLQEVSQSESINIINVSPDSITNQ